MLMITFPSAKEVPFSQLKNTGEPIIHLADKGGSVVTENRIVFAAE